MKPSSLNRARRDRELAGLAEGEEVDVLVIGGGVSGTGVALDAVTRGLRVALIERRDLAHGTSRWSSKLIHGGLRYLAKGDVSIARESAEERGILIERTAPHLLRALPMVTPIGAGIRHRMAPLNFAGLLAGEALRVAAGTTSKVLPPPRIIGRKEALRLCPAMRTSGVRLAFLSYDGQLSDDARLVVALARTAAAHGAKILTYCSALSIDRHGAEVRDERSGATFRIRARHVVNATGVWADTLVDDVKLSPSKGVHVVLSGDRVGNPTAALLVNVPGTLSRFVFLLPQPDGRVYLGLTDDPVDAVEDEPTATPNDVRFLLETASRALERPLTEDDVIGTYAGLRPLLAGEAGSSADLSRHHHVHEGKHDVLTLVGGKLTTYRKMAEDAVDVLAARPGVTAGPCLTKVTPLVGASGTAYRSDDPETAHLALRYGSEATEVAALRHAPRTRGRVVDHLPYLMAELEWGLLHEGALTVGDLLDRRTRIGLAPADRARALPRATELLAAHDDRNPPCVPPPE